MHTSNTRTGLALAAACFALALAACTSSTSASTGPAPDTHSSAPAPAPENSSGDGSESDGEYAFGTNREQMAQAIEAAFTKQNGKVRWEGDTLTLSVDGSMTDVMPGFSECMVLDQLLEPDDITIIEFPDGTVACADVLSDL